MPQLVDKQRRDMIGCEVDSMLHTTSNEDAAKTPKDSGQSPDLVDGRRRTVRFWIAVGAPIIVVVIGVLTLIGCALDVTTLKNARADLAPMKVNTAIVFVLAGMGCLAVSLRPPLGKWQHIKNVAAYIVVAVGALTVVEWVVGVDLGIDNIVYSESTKFAGTIVPGRMTIWAAVSFALAGIAIFLADSRNKSLRSISQTTAVFSGIPASISLFGHAAGCSSLYGMGLTTHLAVHTDVAFVLVSVAIIAANRNANELKTILRDAGTAIAGVSIATYVRWLAMPVLGGDNLFLFHGPAIFIAAWFCGFRAGLIATLLSAVCIEIFLNSLTLAWDPKSYTELFAISTFIVLGLSLSLFVDRAKLANHKRHVAEWEKQLQMEANIYHRGLIESSLDPFMVIDEQGNIADVNAATEAYTGYSRDELIRHEFSQFFVNPQSAQVAFNLAFRRGVVKDCSLGLLHRNGSVVPVLFNASVYRTNGDVLVFAAARDNSDQERANETASRLAAIVETSNDAIIATSLDTVVTAWNKAAEDCYGYTAEAMIGRPVSTIVPPDKMDEFIDSVNKLRQGQRIPNHETVRRHKDGSQVPVSVGVNVIKNSAGQVVGFASIAHDMSARRELENELRVKNEALLRASLAKDRFLASMSHELRTPLNAIIGFTGTLLMRLPGELNADQEEQLQTVEMSAVHLLSLINDLLDLAKIESGKMSIKRTHVSCSSVIQEVAVSLRPAAEAKGLEFETILQSDDAVVFTDRRALVQILLNLANNAIKFTSEGRVAIESSQQTVDDKLITEICVSDTGVGIPVKDRAKLFRAFEQLDSELPIEKGTGLGLHLSRKLAHLLGGEITLMSELGKGSAFTLRLFDDAAVSKPVACELALTT